MTTSLICTPADGTGYTLTKCLRFSLLRERYQPFSVLQAQFAAAAPDAPVPQHVSFQLGGQTVHAGLVQKAELRQTEGITVLNVTAKGDGVALLHSQLDPGNYYNATLQSLLSAYTLPGVTWDQTADTVNYIVVDERQPLWEAVIAYAYKLRQGFPYVRVPNLVCVAPQAGQTAVTLPADAVLAAGTSLNTADLISRIDMADLDGQYGTFTLTNSEAVRRGIISVQNMRFDRQFLYAPPDAMQYRISRSSRRMTAKTVRYAGYCGEDIEDLIACGTLSGRVSRIRITGGADGIVTEDTLYYDDLCNPAPSE